VLDGISAELNELPAEKATAGSVRQLEEAKEHLQHMAMLSDELDEAAANIVSSLREATEFYRHLLDRFTEDDAEEPTEEEEGEH
jgi:predicted metalloendopeptidase